ncbi:MAG: hypothetical protein KatS3mg076_3013 [Candidatus Binatia bacterium]|nr:MAG: hypothetical protein KatS3mg076_3013 [Candidatus Binatia bacterium]
MSERELRHREKQELRGGAERTRPARAFLPDVDIYETDDALVVVADVPGVDASHVNVELRDHRLTIDAVVDPAEYENLRPLYTEYYVGPYHRAFELGELIDQDRIEARVADGVLTLTLPKLQKARARKIPVTG